MAMSWELLAWAMPKILVVCITSTEKLGSQLAIRDPVREYMDFMIHCLTHSLSVSGNSTTTFSLGFLSDRLTIKVEEVVVLVDMWSGIWSGSYRADVVFQTSALLLASRLAPISINVEGCTTRWARGILFEPRAQTRAEGTHTHK